MAYGVHWEWRGFGVVDGAREELVRSLAPAAVPERAVADTYLWHPRLTNNVKLRAWEGGGSFKVKRQLDPGSPDGPSLWMESPAEDYDLPLDGAALVRALAALGVTSPPPTGSTPMHAPALLAWLTGVVEELRLVEVRKVRRTFVWDESPVPVLVELAEIERPEPVRSIGVEDTAGLQADADPARVTLARRSVSEAAAVFGRGLRALTYLEAVAIWARGGVVARPGVG